MKPSDAMRSKFFRAVTLTLSQIALAAMSGPVAAADTSSRTNPSLAMASAVQPNSLLSIDQNRRTVVDRVVSIWGDALAGSDAGLDKEQLRTLLMGLRADHLLAASLAGTLDGLRNAIAVAQTATPPNTTDKAQLKALGDPARDLVYTPVVPCRIVDTRSVGGAFAAGGQTRNYHAFLTSGTFATQGGASSNCGIPANPSAVALNITTVGGGGFLTAWQFNTSMPLAATVIPGGGIVANGAVVPTCQSNCGAEFSIFTFGAHVVIDIVGYFKAPSTTALDCVTLTNHGPGVNDWSNNAPRYLQVPVCAAGYGMTGTSALWDGPNVAGVYLQEVSSSNQTCWWFNASGSTQSSSLLGCQAICCRVPGQ